MAAESKHIVFTPIGSLGDLNPLVAVALELVNRGHRATIATTEFYRRKIEELGLGFVPIRPDMSPEDPELMRRVMDLKNGPEFVIRQLIMPRLREMYDDLSKVIPKADFVVTGELAFATRILAEQHNVPWAMVALQPMSFFSVYDPSVLAPLPFTKYLRKMPTFLHRVLLHIGKKTSRNWVRPIADIRKELGLPELDAPLLKDKFSPYLNLALFSELLGKPQLDWPVNTLQTGFVFYDNYDKDSTLPPPLRSFLDAGEPPIIFTLGSSAVHAAGTFYEESAKAAGRLNRRAVLLIGKNQTPKMLPPEIAAFDYAPFSKIFPRAAAVVHQGGVGTTAQALRAGVPQLVMPYGFDQPDNAARLEHLGVARSISRDEYSEDNVVKELSHLFADPQYAYKAKIASLSLQAENGLSNACGAIEKEIAKTTRQEGLGAPG